MNRTKYIIVASVVSLVVLVATSYIISLNKEKSFVSVAVAKNNMEEGMDVNDSNITWVKIETSKIDVDNYITETISTYNNYVLSSKVEKGQVITKSQLIKKEEYLEKVEGLQYIALPIKSATEGVCYKIKKGDKISVYYTAKKKLVDGVLQDKKKIYSVGTSDTLVTCLLYENIEIMATTNNVGSEASGTTITDIVVRLTEDEALELANLKEQGTFTLAVI